MQSSEVKKKKEVLALFQWGEDGGRRCAAQKVAEGEAHVSYSSAPEGAEIKILEIFALDHSATQASKEPGPGFEPGNRYVEANASIHFNMRLRPWGGISSHGV